QVGMRGAVDRAVVPENAGGKGQVVGECCGPVKDAVAVRVFEERDLAELFLELEQFGPGQVGAGPLGDEQPAAIVEAGTERIANVRRAGDLLNNETGRHGKAGCAVLVIGGGAALSGRPSDACREQGDAEEKKELAAHGQISVCAVIDHSFAGVSGTNSHFN